MTLVCLQIVTGLLLLIVYRGDPNHAYESMTRIMASGFWTWMRGVHNYASAASIVSCALYVIVALFEGAYKPPHHARWYAAVFGVLLILMLQLTGHTLPWDERAVRTTVIETGIAADAPVIGLKQAKFLRAGTEVGPHTLPFWFAAHVWMLPLGMLVLCGLPLGLAKGKLGRASSVFSLLLVVAIMGVAATIGPPALTPSAVPDDFLSVDQPPEWYVYPLHALLRMFQSINPSATFVGTMVIPGVTVLFLLLLPLLDKKGGASWVRVVGAVGVLGLGGLSVAGYNYTHSARPLRSVVEIKPEPGLIGHGKEVFKNNGCMGCHSVLGQGGIIGPKLDTVGDRRTSIGWHIKHLKEPTSLVTGSTMPRYDHMKADDLKALANYLVSLKKD